MVLKAARSLHDQIYKGVDHSEDYGWSIRKGGFIRAAQIALTECGALECLEALDWCVAEINRDSPSVLNARKVMSEINGSAPE
jgi:hypothetical protein